MWLAVSTSYMYMAAHPSFRTFIGGIPMLTSMNIVAQLRRVARLKGRLQEVSLTVPESSDVLTTAGRT